MQHTPRPQEIYRHFKGDLYQIMTLAEHSETGEQLVIYQAMYGEFRTYACPLKTFMEKVDRMEYPDARQEYRFEPADKKREPAEESGAAEGRTMEYAGSLEEKAGSRAMEQQNMDETKAETIRENPKVSREEYSESIAKEAEELNMDPMVLEFLDASTYEERLNILAGLHYRITDDMINVMAMATDIEVKPGDVEERYAELRNCLHTLEKFECNRLR